MKALLKILQVIIFLGTLFLSGWMLVKGIIQVVYAINPFIAKEVVIGVLKIIFCEIPLAIGVMLCYGIEEYIFWKI